MSIMYEVADLFIVSVEDLNVSWHCPGLKGVFGCEFSIIEPRDRLLFGNYWNRVDPCRREDDSSVDQVNGKPVRSWI